MVPKDVIFVIDVSGSMIGTKIRQVKWTNTLTQNTVFIVIIFC